MRDLFNKLASSKTNQMKNNTLNNLAALGQININVAPAAKATAQRQEPRQQRQERQQAQRPMQHQHRPQRLSLGEALYNIRMTDWEAQWIKAPATETLVFNPESQSWEHTPKAALAMLKMSNLLWTDSTSRRVEDPSRIQYVKKSPAALERICIERGLCVPLTLDGRNAGKADLVRVLVADDAKERAERHVHLQSSQGWMARNRKRADSKMKSLRARARAAGLSDIIRLKAEVNGDQWMLADAGIPELTPFWVSVAINNKDRAYALNMQAGTADTYWKQQHAERVRLQQERQHSELVRRFKATAAAEILRGVIEDLSKEKPLMSSGKAEEVLCEFYRAEGAQPATEDRVLAEFRQYAQTQFLAITSPGRAFVMPERKEPVLFERIKRTRAEVVQDAYRKVQASPRLDGSRGRKQEYLAKRLVEAGAIADEPKVKAHAVKMVAAKPKGPLNLLEVTVAQPRRLK